MNGLFKDVCRIDESFFLGDDSGVLENFKRKTKTWRVLSTLNFFKELLDKLSKDVQWHNLELTRCKKSAIKRAMSFMSTATKRRATRRVSITISQDMKTEIKVDSFCFVENFLGKIRKIINMMTQQLDRRIFPWLYLCHLFSNPKHHNQQ